MHESDNVAIVANDGGLPAGTELTAGLVLSEFAPQGHKLALLEIGEESPIIRYGVCIGYALKNLVAGSWVHEGVMRTPAAPALDGLDIGSGAPATAQQAKAPPLEGYTFLGYRNADGTVGTRNILGVTTTVQCVAGVVDHAVRRIKSEMLRRFPNVDDVVALDHSYGCGVAIDAPDAVVPIRTLHNISRNPNFGGEVLVVSLGCEKLQPERLLSFGGIPVVGPGAAGPGGGGLGEHADVIRLQDPAHHGFESMVHSIMSAAERTLTRLDARRRELVPVSELVVGVQCGGSDAFSGVTANPAVGYCTDLLVRAGASVLFSEVTEVRDGIALLVSRAASASVAQSLLREMAWYDAYLARGGADRSANTTPGNKRGGLSNIVEKAMGSIVKSGSTPIVDVLPPGERLRQRGLNFAATPASDFICGTLQVAAGMNLHVFTTGRGTPYGLACVPVVKVATRSELARRWHDLMDINAGTIADASASIEEVGWELFRCLLDVASGTRRTCAERLGLHNALTLFNPAPVT